MRATKCACFPSAHIVVAVVCSFRQFLIKGRRCYGQKGNARDSFVNFLMLLTAANVVDNDDDELPVRFCSCLWLAALLARRNQSPFERSTSPDPRRDAATSSARSIAPLPLPRNYCGRLEISAQLLAIPVDYSHCLPGNFSRLCIYVCILSFCERNSWSYL